jgi:uncharacterized protein YcbK (DUF882 family)
MASCTAVGPDFDPTPSYNGVGAMTTDVAQTESAASGILQKEAQGAYSSHVSAGESSVSGQNADSEEAVATAATEPESAEAAGQNEVAVPTSKRPPQPAGEAQTAETASSDAPQPASGSKDAAEPDDSSARQVAANEEPEKRGFLASFFSASPAPTATLPIAREPERSSVVKQPTTKKATPIIDLASNAPVKRPPVQRASFTGDALPGVRKSSLFEISRKSGLDDDSDIDLHEQEGGSYQVASAAGFARLAPNGLLKQRESVDVACLKPTLVRILKTAERHFGQKMVVTSGYRSPAHNQRVRGARNSMHMYCAAADVQMPGVSKWELAQFVRTMPGRGGVGTYCHTNSVHIDVGPERDWNWRCRRK